VLRTAGLLDKKKRWSGARTHLVQTGDILDRGPDSRKIMDLLMQLEKQAFKAGGRVHVLLGNHETMNLYGDLRYVSPGEYAAFATARSDEVRDAFYDSYIALRSNGQEQSPDGAAVRQRWYEDHPLGWVEHRQAFGPSGKYGKWLREKNAVVRIDRILFAHGGLSPRYSSWSIRQINEKVRQELKDFSQLEKGVVTDAEGPLWFRGLARAPEGELSAHVDNLLQRYGVDHVVIAHTPTQAAILPRFDGKVILIDVGLAEVYGGPMACLIVENGRLRALHERKLLDLPAAGGDLLAYLKAAAAAGPASAGLQALIANGGRIELRAE